MRGDLVDWSGVRCTRGVSTTPGPGYKPSDIAPKGKLVEGPDCIEPRGTIAQGTQRGTIAADARRCGRDAKTCACRRCGSTTSAIESAEGNAPLWVARSRSERKQPMSRW